MDTPTPTWNYTIRTDSPRQANSVDCGVYMLAFCIILSTNSPLRFSVDKARHWRSRIGLLLAHWTPSPPPKPPHHTEIPLQLQDGQPILRVPPQTTTPIPPKRTSNKQNQLVLLTAETALQERRVSSGEGEGKEGAGGRGRREGEGKKRARQRPDSKRPVRRKKADYDREPATTRKRTKPTDPKVSEPPHRKQKKSRQILMSTFLRT